jgi:hypothetical protein
MDSLRQMSFDAIVVGSGPSDRGTNGDGKYTGTRIRTCGDYPSMPGDAGLH